MSYYEWGMGYFAGAVVAGFLWIVCGKDEGASDIFAVSILWPLTLMMLFLTLVLWTLKTSFKALSNLEGNPADD